MDKDEIILDIDVSCDSDCDITFTIESIPCGITDLKFRGLLRLILVYVASKPPALVLEIFFLNKPSIDFQVTGSAQLANLPGLIHLVNYVITKELASIMVFPEKIIVELAKLEPKHDWWDWTWNLHRFLHRATSSFVW